MTISLDPQLEPAQVERRLSTPERLAQLRQAANCSDSPTGSHIFSLGADGEGECRHCHRLHSQTRAKSQMKNRTGGRTKMTTETKKTEPPMLNIHDLEKATGKDGREIRRILRKEFNGGAGKEYIW